MEKENKYIPKEAGFENKINERLELWATLIDESNLNKETKELLKNRLVMLKEYKKHYWELGNAFYNTVVNLRNATDKKGEEADMLFKNLRDDIWDLFDEI